MTILWSTKNFSEIISQDELNDIVLSESSQKSSNSILSTNKGKASRKTELNDTNKELLKVVKINHVEIKIGSKINSIKLN